MNPRGDCELCEASEALPENALAYVRHDSHVADPRGAIRCVLRQ